MRTLLVGDVHLKARVMLPLIDAAIATYQAQRVIFIGDYVDDYYCERDGALYLAELDALLDWKKAQQIEVVMLLGNHDAPYLVDRSRNYSLQFDRSQVKRRLFALDLQVAFWLGKFLVSHAGFVRGENVQPWQLRPLTTADARRIDALEKQISPANGGSAAWGSPLWVRPQELEKRLHRQYRQQIVGHTPRARIDLSTWQTGRLAWVDIDNFNLRPLSEPPYVAFHGAGELLLVEGDALQVVATGWANRPEILTTVGHQRGYHWD